MKQNVVKLELNSNEKLQITQKVIDGIKPRSKAYFVRDTKLTGFAIKVNPKGQSKYIAESRLDGSSRNKRVEIGVVGVLSLAQARKKARTMLSAIQSGVDPKERDYVDKLSLKNLVESYYRSNQRIKSSRAEEYISSTLMFMKPFLSRHANDLSAKEYFEHYQKNIKVRPTVADRIHRQLRAAYAYAVKKQLVDKNPTDIVTVQDRPVSTPRERSLSLDAELPAFMRSLFDVSINVTIRDVLLLMTATGMRRREALELRWDQIDFDRFIILLIETKNKHQHMIPMSNLVRSMLVQRDQSEDRHDEYVFPNAKGSGPLVDIRKAMKKVLDGAGITESLAPHDLRRTFTAIGQELGLEIYQIKALLNHADNSVTARHYQDKRAPALVRNRRKLLNQVSDYLEHSATGFVSGIRSDNYLDGMFEEEKTDDGSVEYFYAMEKERLEMSQPMQLTHAEMKDLDPEAYGYRNEKLEKAYDWEW